MLVAISDFPSKGHNCNLGSIDIHPMTYKDIIEYNSYLSNTYLQKLYRDLKCLDKDLGEEVMNQISFFDFDFLVYLKKSFSLNDPSVFMIDFTCEHCHTPSQIQLNSNQISYSDFDERITKLAGIKLGPREKQYTLSFPTMKEVRNALDIFLRYKEDVDPEIFLLCLCIKEFSSSPNEVKSIIENAIKDDIINLKFIASIFSGSIKECEVTCPNCKKVSVIRILNSMTDIFRFLKINIKVNENKIILSQTV